MTGQATHICPQCGQLTAGAGVCAVDRAVLVALQADPMLGQSLGSYRIVAMIGEGGMGRVYRAIQPAIGSRVAVKILSAACSQDQTLVQRFFAEARAVNLIRHENIVNVLDLAQLPDGRPYLIMEYLDGCALDTELARVGALDVQKGCRIASGVLGALQAAHSAGIVHRDLKPGNVFLTPAGHVKVLDFGVAKLLPAAGQPSGLTQSGSLLGTPYYMSPEQAASHPVDHRSDLYSMGVMLYELLTGYRPFRAQTLFDLLKQHLQEIPAPPSQLRAGLPGWLDATVLRALEKDPARRFQSAAEFQQALQGATSVSLPPLSMAPTVAASSGAVSLSVPVSVPAVSAAVPTLTVAPTQVQAAPTAARRSSAAIIVFTLIVTIGVIVVSGFFTCLGLSYLQKSIADNKRPAQVHQIMGLNFARFDPSAFLPRADQIAHEYFRDARLSEFSCDGARADGTADVSATSRSIVQYMFTSTTANKLECVVVISVTQGQVSSIASAVGGCNRPPLPTPSCTIAQVVKKLPGVGPASAIILAYRAADREQPKWWASVDGKPQPVLDDCRPGRP